MTDPAAKSAADPLPPGEALTHRTAHGMLWLVIQAAGTKAVTFFGQIALAWFLFKEDFELAALAFAVQQLISVFQKGGIREVLVRRQRHIHHWSTPGAWMSLALGLVSSGLILALAPAIVRFYERPGLMGLLIVFAIAQPLDALSAVPEANLRAQLRFKALGIVGLATFTSHIVLAVALAWLGAGAYALVAPWLVSFAGRTAALWLLARPRIGRRPRLRLWRHMLADNTKVLLFMFALMCTMQGAYIVLGRLYTGLPLVGVFYWAWNLAEQVVRAVNENLAQVLMPALGRLSREPARQVAAFLRAARIMALVGVPICVLQAALAEPIVRLLFPERWLDGVPVIQVASIGMAARLMMAPSQSLIMAQGRFAALLAITAVYAVVYLAAAIAGGVLGGAEHAAVATAAGVSIVMVLAGPAFALCAIAPGGGSVRDVASIYLAPVAAVVAGAAAGLIAWWGVEAVWEGARAGGRITALARIAAVGAIAAPAYLALARAMAPQPTRELVSLARRLLTRRA